MQPLKPEVKEAILAERADVDAADVQEYERLLSRRFTIDPDRPSTESATAADSDGERLRELHEKLFGPRPRP